MISLLLACADGTSPSIRWTTPTGETGATTPADPDPSCEVAGCLREVVSYGTFDRADIEPWLDPSVALLNGYEVLAITYWTAEGPATATVTLPVDPLGDEPAEGYPVVVNAHGTLGLDDPCTLSGTSSGTGLAALFGGRGAIGVAPDYPGLGSPGFHRYLDGESEAHSVLDAIRAAIRLARWSGTATSERAAVVGLSQGGHATLWSAALHADYAPELDIRAFAASGPASLYEEQWRSGVSVDGPHLVMHAMLAWSFSEASGEDDDGIWAAATAATVDEHLLTRCNWSPNFLAEPLLVDDFPTVAEDVFSAAFLSEYASGDWADFVWIGERFDRNRVRPWAEQTAPLAIWQGTDDEVVPAWMTQAMVDDLRDGGIDVDLHLVEGGHHTDTAFGFLAWPELATDESIGWVLERLAD